MKKYAFLVILSIFMGCGLLFSSCEKEPDPTPNPEIPADSNTDDPIVNVSIIGHWRLDKATQIANGNESDQTNFYSQNFQLTFLEDGTLITSDGHNETAMQWTLEGDQLGFIQAPDAAPVMYMVKVLTEQNLMIENGTGSNCVTTMEFHRE